MTKWGMTIDLDACTGCSACVVACGAENNVPISDKASLTAGRSMDWLVLVTQIEGTYDDISADQYPRSCQHCTHAPCTVVCPVGATVVTEEGLVAQITDRCLGCRYCMVACPYDAKSFNWSAVDFDSSNGLNPDVAVRRMGVVEKCTWCNHRRLRAQDDARVNGTDELHYEPACVEVCPASAIAFGDLNDPDSEVYELARNPRATHLLEELATEPNVIYLHPVAKPS